MIRSGFSKLLRQGYVKKKENTHKKNHLTVNHQTGDQLTSLQQPVPNFTICFPPNLPI